MQTRQKRSRPAALALICSVVCFSPVLAGEPDVDFRRDIAPIFETHCLRCHNTSHAKGEFSLESAASLAASEFVVAGDPQGSRLLDVVTADNGKRPQMPKSGPALTAKQVERLRTWIADGAVWPQAFSLPRSWSLQPLAVAPPPEVEDTGRWRRSSLDSFVLRRLRDNGLTPAGPAPKRQLIRRVKVSLLGLQPSWREIERFEADTRPDAYERLLSRYLNSPSYGERWAQHWLDVARFSESNGFEEDAPRPHSWPYRDYVIDSLNRDTRYDQFVREQLAGDVISPVTREGMIATGFLVAGPHDHAAAVAASEVERKRAREVQLEEMLTTVSQTILGMTVNCARCHDHKFDPIPQKDYYRMKAVFEGVDQAEGRLREARRIVPPNELERYEQRVAEHNAKKQRMELELADLKHRRAALDDQRNLPPLNRSIAYWQFAENSDAPGGKSRDLKGGESLVEAQGAARFGKPPASPIRALNSDNRVLDTGPSSLTRNQPDGAGYAILPTLAAGAATGELLPAPNTSLSLFARVRFTGRFRETDDVLRVGDAGNKNRDSYGFEMVSEGTQQSTARVRFVVTPRGAEKEVSVTFPTALELDHWYDLCGVFASSTTAKGAGRLTVYVHDPNLGEPIGPAVHKSVPFGDLESGGRQNLLFFVAPYFHNGPQPNAQMDMAAVWREALTVAQIARLSSIEPSRETLVDKEVVRKRAEQQHDLDRRIAAAERRREQVIRDLQQLQQTFPKAYIGVRRQPPVTVVFERGDVRQPGEPVAPAGLSAVRTISAEWGLAKDAIEGRRRERFAHWATDPKNPLTARVIVNRVWHHHFGVGLVSTPSDFGVNGDRPSHPAMLDWLTARFIEDGWSLKGLHRRILGSSAWRQASTFNEAAARKDANNRLIWRFAPRRLDAETIRDSMLEISGELNAKIGGPSYQPFDVKRFNTYFYNLVDSGRPEFNRRTIYRMKVNTGRDPLLDALDCPAPSVLTPRRRQTVTPLQALALMNDSFSMRQSHKLAERIRGQTDDPRRRARLAWRSVLGRTWTDREAVVATELVGKADLSTLCWVLFNSSEFLQLR